MSSVFRLAVWFALPPNPTAPRSPAQRARATPARASSLGSAPRPASKATCLAALAAPRAAPAQTPAAPQLAPAPGVPRSQAASPPQQTPCLPQARAACATRRSEDCSSRPARGEPLLGTHIAWCSSEMHTSGASPYALMTSNCGTPDTLPVRLIPHRDPLRQGEPAPARGA